MPSAVISLRISPAQAARLKQKARQSGLTPSEIGAALLDEGLRRDEFAFIEFRDSPLGRLACIQGSRLAVWQVVSVTRSYAGNAAKAAAHLRWPVAKVQAALNYERAYPEEIAQAIEDNQAGSFERIRRMLPQAEEFVIPASGKTRK